MSKLSMGLPKWAAPFLFPPKRFECFSKRYLRSRSGFFQKVLFLGSYLKRIPFISFMLEHNLIETLSPFVVLLAHFGIFTKTNVYRLVTNKDDIRLFRKTSEFDTSLHEYIYLVKL